MLLTNRIGCYRDYISCNLITGEDTGLSDVPILATLKRCAAAGRLIIRRLIIRRQVISDDHTASPPKSDPALVKVLARARDWYNRLASGKAASVAEMTRQDDINKSYISRVMRLAFLAPEISRGVLQVPRARIKPFT